jgi:Tol biopolymer transport system component
VGAVRRLGWVAAAVLGGALGCAEWAGPGLGRPGLVIVPVVSPGPGSGGTTVLFDDLDRLHVTVTPAVGASAVGAGAVVDTTVPVDAAGNATLTVRVPVAGSGQTYQVVLEGYRSSDSAVLYSGSDIVTVRPSGAPPVDSVPVTYVGPCALGVGCLISVGPQGFTLKQAGSVPMTTLIKDVLGNPVPGVPVKVTDVTPGLVGLASDLTVTALSGTSCGPARAAADIPGSSDTLRLEVTAPVTIAAVLFAGDSAAGASSGVFCHNTNGTGRFRISANGASGDVNPRYSPDRQRVAYTFNPGTQQQLWVSRWAGDTDALVVSDTVAANRPRWSPNGVHLAYQCGSNVCVIADATGPISLLSQAPRSVFAGVVPTRSTGSGSFAWDPRNPDRLAFPLDSVFAFDSVTLRQTMTSALYVANFDGSAVTQLTPSPLDAGTGVLQIQEVDWSPRGDVIVFSASDTVLTSKLYVINADGTGFRQLTHGVDSDARPIVSPDGSQVLFLRNVGGCSIDYWRIRVDGTAEQQVTSEKFCDISTNALGHDWSPDGSEIVLVGAGPNGQYSGFMVYRIAAGTTAATYLTARQPVRGLDAGSLSNDFQPSWRP